MIKKNNQTIGAIYKGLTPIEKIYKGSVLVWEAWKKLIKQGVPPLTLSKCKENKLLNYQIYGNSKQKRLPDGYTELEYIESTGTQYIDTGVVPDNTTGFKIRLSLPEVTSDIFRFGCRQDNSNTRFVLGSYGGSAYFGFGKLILGSAIGSITVNTPFIAYLNYYNDRYAYINDNTKTTIDDISSTTFTYSLIMFGRNSVGNISSSAQTIYSCQITKGDTLVRNFVPAKNSSGTIGMYDLVSNVFYTNAGTGTFTAGPEVDLPDGYIKLDYIESTGTQYIDTNYIPNSKTKIQANVAFTEDTGAMQNFGAIANLGTSSKVNYARWHFGVFSNKLCVFRENTTQSGDIKIEYDDKFHNYEITNTSCSLDGTTVETDKYTNSNISFVLFARNGYTTAGGTPSITAHSKSKLKSFKIYEDNVLIRNYIPCINQSNVIGLYDIINDVFYSNQGTGTFNAGSQIYADYIDFENQKVVKNVRELVITGDEEWGFTNGIARFTIANSQLSDTGIDYSGQLCNYFKCDLITTGGTTKGASVYYSSSLGGTFFRVRDDALTSSTVAKNFFKDLYNSGKPCKIYYQSVAPTEESVELPDILLNSGTNIVDIETNITPSNLWLKYKGKEV